MSEALSTVPAVEPLTDLETAVLTFAVRTFRHAGVREEAITVELGLTPWRYEQILGQVLDNPAALVAEPMLVNRLRRLRATRRRQRRSAS